MQHSGADMMKHWQTALDKQVDFCEVEASELQAHTLMPRPRPLKPRSRRRSPKASGLNFSTLGGATPNASWRAIKTVEKVNPKIVGTLFWGPYNKDPTIYRVLY